MAASGIEQGAPLPFLGEALLFLALAGVLIPLLQRLRINQVIGFLVVGVAVGPLGLGSLVDRWPELAWITLPRRQGVQALADLGVVFLMFLIGLELSLQRMWALRRWVFGTGSAQVLLCAAVLGGLAWAFGNPPKVALVLGLVLSLSSTAVVMQLMSQDRTLATPLGQASFSVLMLQDFAVVPLLIVVDLLARRGGPDEVVGQLLRTGLLSVGVVGLIVLGGRRLVAPLFRAFARQHQPEVLLALTLLVALSLAGLTAVSGLSMALGAFLAGLLLAETEYRHEVELTVEPFKGLLMGVFFMSVGMGIDVREVAQAPGWIALSVLGLFLVKGGIVMLLLRRGGLSWGQALEGGALLGQGGEFAFIVVGAALGMRLLDAAVGQFMLLVVSLSLMLTPLAARAGQRLGRTWDRARSPAAAGPAPDGLDPPEGLAGHVVLIGCGRVGQLLGDVLERQRVPYLAVEHDVQRASRLRRQGRPVSYGNATRGDLLRRLGLDRAACMVVTMDQPAAAMRVVRQARAAWPDLPIYVRSHDDVHALELLRAGATRVVPEMLEAGLLLTAHALQTIGLTDGEVQAVIHAEREGRAALRAEASAAVAGYPERPEPRP